MGWKEDARVSLARTSTDAITTNPRYAITTHLNLVLRAVVVLVNGLQPSCGARAGMEGGWGDGKGDVRRRRHQQTDGRGSGRTQPHTNAPTSSCVCGTTCTFSTPAWREPAVLYLRCGARAYGRGRESGEAAWDSGVWDTKRGHTRQPRRNGRHTGSSSSGRPRCE